MRTRAIVVVVLCVAALLVLPAFAFGEDSYPIENLDSRILLDSDGLHHTMGVAQTITAVGGTLDSAEFVLAQRGASKNDGPVGSVFVRVYPCDAAGTITGPALATTDSKTVESLNNTTLVRTSFTFASPPTLTDGGTYLLALEGTSDVFWADVGTDASEPAHPGICLRYDIWAEGWVVEEGVDCIFYAHQTPVAPEPEPEPVVPSPASSDWSRALLLVAGIGATALVARRERRA